MRALRRLVAALSALAFVAVLAVGSSGSAVGAATLDPSLNIAPPAGIFSLPCRTDATGTACDELMVAALDSARAHLGQPAYKLPATFADLAAEHQLLILINSDRALYHRTKVTGFLRALNSSATSAAQATSPTDPEHVASVNGHISYGWSSNWGGGSVPMNSPLYAYYVWMYQDGLDADGSSINFDCSRANTSGCWVHRNNTLYSFGKHMQVALGVGSDQQGQLYSWTELFQSFAAHAKLPYRH